MLGVAFWFAQISAIKIIEFKTFFITPLKVIFCTILEVWKVPKWPGRWLINGRFEDYIYDAEKLTRTIHAWRIIPVPNWIEAS